MHTIIPDEKWLFVAAATFVAASSLFLFNLDGAESSENVCNYPYLTVQTDPSGDQIGGSNGINAQSDIERVGIGEPFTSCTDKSITFVLKVANLSPLPPGGAWMVEFQVGTDTLYLEMNTESSSIPSFDYGYIQGVTPLPADPTRIKYFQCSRPSGASPCPVTGSYQSDGTIVLKLNTADPLVLIAPGGSSHHVDLRPPGTVLAEVKGRTQLGGSAGANIADSTIDMTDPGTYTVNSNLACAGGGLPVAVLTAIPTSGPAPLSVNFDGSTSTHGPCTTLTTYSLDLGDGGPVVSQSSPLFSYTYVSAGDYLARLVVSDSAGQVSTNTAQVPISVAVVAPPLSSVVSRKTHGSTPFDVNLPLAGTRGIECRTGGATGDHQIVFTFVNDLVNSTDISASVTTGSGLVSSSTPGPDANQYTVSLTGVANQQNIAMTLTGVRDSVGNSGPVASPQIGVLLGDVNASGNVDAADVGQVQRQNNKPVSSSNFRADVNVTGNIDAADVGQVQRQNSKHL